MIDQWPSRELTRWRAHWETEPPDDPERKADIRLGLLRDTILTASPNRWKKRPDAADLTPKWEYGRAEKEKPAKKSMIWTLAAALRKPKVQ